MQRIITILITLFSFILIPHITQAQSLKIKNLRTQQEENLAKEVAKTNKACGTELSVSLDWTDTKDEDFGKYSFYGYCDGGALSGIERVCGKPNGKESVQAKVKKVICRFGNSRSVALKDGQLDYVIQWGSGNDADYVSEYLMNNL